LTTEEYLAGMLNEARYVEQLIKESAAKGGKFLLASSGAQPSSYDAVVYAMLSAAAPETSERVTPAGKYIRASPVLSQYLARVTGDSEKSEKFTVDERIVAYPSRV
jgi:hypothetical protein